MLMAVSTNSEWQSHRGLKVHVSYRHAMDVETLVVVLFPSLHCNIRACTCNKLVFALVGVGEMYCLFSLASANVMMTIKFGNFHPQPQKPCQKQTHSYINCLFGSSRDSFEGHFSFSSDCICPPGTYHRLKLALLLALVTSNRLVKPAQHGEFEVKGTNGSAQEHGLHLLAIGRDTLLMERLQLYACQFSASTVRSCGGTDLLGSARNDPATGEVFVSG